MGSCVDSYYIEAGLFIEHLVDSRGSESCAITLYVIRVMCVSNSNYSVRTTLSAQELLSDILQAQNTKVFRWLEWWNHLSFERRNDSFLLDYLIDTELVVIRLFSLY